MPAAATGMLSALPTWATGLFSDLPEEAQLPALIFAIVLGSIALLFIVQAGGKSSGGGGLEFFSNMNAQNKRKSMGTDGVDTWISDYNKLHHNGDYVKDGDKAGVEERNTAYAQMVNAYYELATSFYEWGWGQSFHFAQKKFNEGASCLSPPLPPPLTLRARAVTAANNPTHLVMGAHQISTNQFAVTSTFLRPTSRSNRACGSLTLAVASAAHTVILHALRGAM